MFHHTVLLRLAPDADADFLARFARHEAALRERVPGTLLYRLLPNDAPSGKGYTHALFSAFASRAAFDDYDRSALHAEIKAFLGPYVLDLVVADGDDGAPAPA
jgi:heme-degrading monooxygenase HmoA